MIDIAPFEFQDLDTFDPGVFDTAALRAPGVIDAAKKVWPGNAISAKSDGKTIAVVGVARVGKCGHCWAFLSDEMRKHIMFLHRNVKRLLPRVALENGFERLWAEVHPEFDAGHSWIERLGFCPVGGITQKNRAKLNGTYVEYEKWL